MDAAIITIGNELVSGLTTDTNATWIARKLFSSGIKVGKITTVPDDKAQIKKAFDEAEKSASFVFVTGGLGPTEDDITMEIVADYFKAKLVLNEQIYEHVNAYFRKKGMNMPAVNKKLAQVPLGARVFMNRVGTAAGIEIKRDNTYFYFMPGVPVEMKYLMKEQVLPEVLKISGNKAFAEKIIHTIGIGESSLSQLIGDWQEQLKKENIQLAFLPSTGRVKLRLTAFGEPEEALIQQINQSTARLESIIGDFIFGYDNDKLEVLVGNLLKDKSYDISTAESCTGGYLAHMITAVPGSSAYFKGSVIAYSNEAKMEMLGVYPSIINKYGAVSREVVREMAKGAQNRFDTAYSLAVSGIAGPSGGSVEKPVGTVWIAVATPSRVFEQKFLFGDGIRFHNIKLSALHAMNLLRKELLN